MCFSEALELCGKKMSVAEIIGAVRSDKSFYENSGGGMTLSGGEPLLFFDFTKELLEAAAKEGINTAVETCGYAPAEQVRALLPWVNLWLWDVKAAPEKHKELTGVESSLILSNLRMIDAGGAKMHLRCPLIPGVNDSEAELIRIAELANSLKGCLRIDLEPYHPLGEGKAVKLGMKEYFHADFAAKEKILCYERILKEHTGVEIYHP